MLQSIRKMSEHGASLLLLLFLGTDLGVIIFHIIDKTLAPSSSLCAVAGFCAYLTGYNLIKLFWACLLFAYVLKSTRCSGYVAWILVFAYLLVDEASLLHQKIGDYIASSFAAHLPHAPSLQPRYLELAVLVMVGTLLMAIVAWAYFRSPRSFREMSKDMLLFIVAWAFFGVFTDMAAAVMRGPLIEFVSDKVEDFGEMVVLSLIVWYVFLLTIRNGAPDLFLHDVLFQPLTRRSRNQKGSNLAN
jgi:hypothetical protein